MPVRHPFVSWPAHSVLHHGGLAEKPPAPVSDGAAGLLGLLEHPSRAGELTATTFSFHYVALSRLLIVISDRRLLSSSSSLW